MTLRTLWQLCDVSFNLEVRPSGHRQKECLADLGELLSHEENLAGNGVPPELLEVFEKLAALVRDSDGLSRSLIHGFYYVGTEVRHKVKFYCRQHKIKTVSLMKTRASLLPIAQGLKGDTEFSHKSLPYKDG